MSDADAPPSWHLLSFRIKDDGGYEIVSPTQALLVEMADKPKTTMKSRTPDTNNIVEVIHDEDLMVVEIIGRCRFMANGVDKATSRKAGKDAPRDWDRLKDELKGKKNADGKTIVTAYYLGISMDLRGTAS